MRRLLLLVILGIGMALPLGNPTLAQASDPETIPYYCELDYFLSEVVRAVENITTLEDFIALLDYSLNYAVTCFPYLLENVVNTLEEALVGGGGGSGSTETLNPEDGILTEAEAEFLLMAAFGGDYESANLYLCPEEQIQPEDVIGIESITVEAVDCTATNSGDMACDITLTFEDQTVTNTLTFTVVDGKACTVE